MLGARPLGGRPAVLPEARRRGPAHEAKHGAPHGLEQGLRRNVDAAAAAAFVGVEPPVRRDRCQERRARALECGVERTQVNVLAFGMHQVFVVRSLHDAVGRHAPTTAAAAAAAAAVKQVAWKCLEVGRSQTRFVIDECLWCSL